MKKLQKIFRKNRKRTLFVLLAIITLLSPFAYLITRDPREASADILLKFDEGYGTSSAVNDSNGSISAGSITNATWQTSDLCKDEKCLHFDGDGDYVSFSDNVNLDFASGNTFTISGWFRHPVIATNPDYLIAKHESGTAGGYKVYMDSDGDMAFAIDDDGTWGPEDVVGDDQSKNYDDNKWHHFAAVKNGSTGIYLYVDGILIDSDESLTATGNLSNAEDFYIGIDADGSSNSWDGFIDEISIVRVAKSQEEIIASYLGNTKSISGAAPVGWWRMDESSWNGTTGEVKDYSGNGNNGTAKCTAGSCTVPTTSTGKFGNGGLFDTWDEEYVEVADDNNSLDLTQAVTISGWVNITAVTASWNHMIASKSDGTDINYELYIREESSILYPRFTYSDATSTYHEWRSTSTFNPSDWHHIAVTYTFQNPNSIKMYVDGSLVPGSWTSGTGSPAPHTGDYSLHITNFPYANGYNGTIDDVRIYDYARSATQILEDMAGYPPSGISASFGGGDESYLSDGLVGYWKMDHTSGNATDYSGIGANLTNNGTTTYVTGKFGNGSEHVPASTQYFSYASTISGVMSMSMWVNPDSNTNYLFDLDGGTHYLSASSGTLSATGFSNPTIYVNGNISSTLTADTWQLVTVTTDTAISSTALNIGRISSNYYDGTIDEVRIYNRALSPAEVQKLYKWAPGSVAEWKFDSNSGTTLYDTSGNGNNGSFTSSPAWVPGKFGSALDFDGSDDMITVNDPGTDSVFDMNNAFTLSAWIYLDGYTTDGSVIVMKYSYAAGGDINYFMATSSSSGDEISCGMYTTGSPEAYTTGTDSAAVNLSLNTWYHISCTFDNSENDLEMYLDGSLIGHDYDFGGNFIVGNEHLYIGRSQGGGSQFNGKIDQLQIYNYARTQEQIISDMNAGHPAPGSPVGSPVSYWKFDEGYGTTANDGMTAGNDLTLSSTSWTNSGKYGKAWNGDGTIWVSRANDADLDFGATESFTLSGWFKTDSATNPANGTEYIISTSAGNTDVGYQVYAKTDGTICFGIDDDGTWTDVESCTTTDYYDGTWHNFVAVRDVGSDTTNIYIDGVLKDSDTDPTTGTLDGDNVFYIGDFDGDNNATSGIEEFAGDIDEVRVYRLAMTADQVATEYNQGKAAVFGATSTDSSGNPTWSSANEYCPPGQGSACTAPIAEWLLDENTGTTGNDTSENSFTTTLTGSPLPKWNPNCPQGSCIQVQENDVADHALYSDVDDSLDFTVNDDFSFSLWVQSTDTGPETSMPFTKGGLVAALEGYGLILSSTNLICSYADGTNVDQASLGSHINDSDWRHVNCVMDRDGSEVGVAGLHMFIDGVLVASDTSINTTATGVTYSEHLRIGNMATNREFTGSVDQVRIYDYARTQAQIAWEYNRGGPVGWYKFDESSWTNDCSTENVYDASGHENHGTSCPNTTGQTTPETGKFNNAIHFDDSDDYIDIDDANSLDLTSNISISAWVNTDANEADNVIVSKGTSYEVGINADGDIYWYNGSITEDDASAKVLTGSWHHVVITNNDTTVTYYVDGIATGTDSAGIGANNATALYIGYDGTNYFDGLVDDVRVFNYVLTPQQVKDIYNYGAVRFE